MSFLGSFLTKGLKTNQLEVNTDEKTLRPIARLKEPRDLFALPKDKDHDCSQQAPRWPIECQVIDERIIHIPYVPEAPEPYYQPTGNELKPRPVGEENGIVVYNYNPISAVNYNSTKKSKLQAESSDSDISSSSRGSTPDIRTLAPTSTTMKSEAHKTIKTDFAQNLLNIHQKNWLDELKSDGKNDEEEDDDEEDNDDDDDEDDDEYENEYVDPNVIENRQKQQLLANYVNNSSLQKPIVSKETHNPIKDIVNISSNIVSPIKLNTKQMARFKNTMAENKDVSLNNKRNKHDNVNSSSSEDEEEVQRRAIKNSKLEKSKETFAEFFTKKDRGSTNRMHLCQTIDAARLSGGNDANSCFLSDSLNSTTATNSLRLSTTATDSVDIESNNNLIEDMLFQLQFSRSSFGGSKLLTNCHPYNADEYDGLEFESRFESGNLAKAVQITPTYYELYLRPDLYTSRSKQWFYFRVRRTKKNIIYRFSIVNLVKSDSLYNDGMRPLMYSTNNAKDKQEGWRRCGENICYYRNDEEATNEEDEENCSYTLTFNIEFPNDNDTVYFAHSYPYTYSELQDYLMDIQKHPVKSKFCKLRLLCRSLAGNNVYYLTVTAPTQDEDTMKKKKSIVVSARVHPSETPASWMMKGLMDFITGNSVAAKRLRHKFIFKLIPMLNPDGVIVGNTRNSLTGKDLNRQYRTVIRETYPSIWYTKAMIKRLIDECGVSMYCDMHAHSRKHNIFIYGCENKRNPEKKLTEQVFPLMMHKNVADKFSFESCKFKIQRSKEGTGRIVVWMLGITNSYTIEASFGGSSLASRKGTHFNTADYEHIGRAFCETLLDYGDENPNKVKLKTHGKCVKQIKKIRKREYRERKAIKLSKLSEQERLRLKIIERLMKEGSSADEPLNIPLSDYSSDEGDTSSSSDNEGKMSLQTSDLEGPCCAPLKAPPCTPELQTDLRKKRYARMRTIMHELDRIYFQPLFHKQYYKLVKIKIQRQKLLKRKQLREKKKKMRLQQLQNKTAPTPKTSNPEIKQIDGEVLKEKVSATLLKKKSETEEEIAVEEECEEEEDITELSTVMNPRWSKRCTGGYDMGTSGNLTSEKCVAKRKKKKKSKQPINYLYEPGAQATAIAAGVNLKPRLKVSRKLRSYLAKRNIILYRRQKTKPKPRSKSFFPRKKSEAQRLLLDMPTTDPGSDIHFSTDDELCPNNSTEHEGFGTVPRTRRNLLQSELQRRYIEEIGDGFNSLKHMPPELIVTSPTKSIIKDNLLRGSRIATATSSAARDPVPPATAPGKYAVLGEFPMIGGATTTAKRTSSWHNLHNSSKCIPKLRVQSPFGAGKQTYEENSKELQLKLSLKKKIWTGVQPDVYSESNIASASAGFTAAGNRNRPLSWGMPPLASTSAQAAAMQQLQAYPQFGNSKKEHKLAKESALRPAYSKDDYDSLLRACTEKLVDWQLSSNKTTPPPPPQQTTMATTKAQRNSRASFGYNTQSENNVLRTIRQSTRNLNSNTELPEPKTRKKRNPLSKLAETTQILTRMAKNKTRTSHSMLQRQNKTTNNGIKFKTGGIVATAVVQPTVKKHKKLSTLSSNNKSNSNISNNNNNTANNSSGLKNFYTKSSINNAETSSNTLVHKMKTKLKKKSSLPKSNVSTTPAAAATISNATNAVSFSATTLTLHSAAVSAVSVTKKRN